MWREHTPSRNKCCNRRVHPRRLNPPALIKQGIAHQSRTIRLPVHVHNLLNKVRRAQRELASSKGVPPSDHQVLLLLLLLGDAAVVKAVLDAVHLFCSFFHLVFSRFLYCSLPDCRMPAPAAPGDIFVCCRAAEPFFCVQRCDWFPKLFGMILAHS